MKETEVVVSMTSFPARIATTHIALESILAQTLPPSRIVLCLSRTEFPEGDAGLPESLRLVIARGVELLWVDANLKAHKKYFYTMQKYPDAAVITVDDDKIYPPTLVSELVESYRRFPKCVTAMHAHLMTFGEDGSLLPYASWKKQCRFFQERPNIALFAVGAGGILYPPHLLPVELFDTAAILATCLDNDDIWLKAMELVGERIPVVVPAGGDRAVYIEGSQTVSLWSKNETAKDAMMLKTFAYVRRTKGISIVDAIRDGQRLPNSEEFRRILEDGRKILAECTSINKKCIEQKARADKAAADYAKLKADLTAEIAAQKDAAAKAVAAKSAAEAAATKQKTVLEGEVARQKTALSAEQIKSKDLNSKLVAARNELAAVKNEALELRVSLDAEKKISAGESEQIAVLKAALQFAASRSRDNSNDTRLLEYSQEVRELRTALEAKRDEAVERAERAGRMAVRLEMLETERDALKTGLSEAKENRDALRGELAQTCRERDALAAELAEARRTLDLRDAALTSFRRGLETARAAHESLETKLRSAATANETLAAERTKSEQTLALLKRDVQIRDTELAKLKIALDSAHKKIIEQEAALKNQTDERCALAKQTARANRAVSDYAKMKSWYESSKAECRKVSDKLSEQTAKTKNAASDYAKVKALYKRADAAYKKLSKSKLGSLTLRYWRIKDGFRRWLKRCTAPKAGRKQDNLAHSVTVVIPTYTKVIWLDDAVKSVLIQKNDVCNLQVLICVNGPDKGYYEELRRAYSRTDDVEILYTPNAGANAGRNIGIEAAKCEFIAFLDCDDMLTSGYFKSLLQYFSDPDVNIVLGRLVDFDEKTGKRDSETYINAVMSKLGAGPVESIQASSFLASFCMKIYRTTFVRNQLGRLDEGERHTEDVLFWARRFDRITGKIYISDPLSSEAYVRRLTENSLSRPAKEECFRFYVVDRLKILDSLQDILLNDVTSCVHSEFVLSRIKAQTLIMKKFFDGLDVDSKRIARQKIQKSQNLFLNKSIFSDVEAIAFCHNFSPSVDASAFVATKRLRMIDQEEGQPLKWHVISQNMAKIRAQDNVFKKYYADFVCAEQIVLNGSFGFAPATQVAFATAALKAAEKLPVPRVVYSRALFVGSHIAAYQYKKAHPEVKWYAEFSDPLSYGVDDKPRPVQGTPDWNDIEQMVYELADVIIFTNGNQRDYMLSYNPRQHLNESIRCRSIVRMHPVIDSRYCKVTSCAYEMDETKINIGFFGTFYITRKCENMLSILDNKKVVLHIFTTNPETMKDIADQYGDRVRINPTVSHFEFLNLASKMDYLILNDTEFPGRINPFLPSKYADYLTTGTPIIAMVAKGSTLSNIDNRAVLAISDISKDFVMSLKKMKRQQRGDGHV